MIKGITSIAPVASEDAYAKLGSLFRSLGLEEGKGWDVDGAKGAPFLAPLGNLELVLGRAPATPNLLVETTELDAVYAVVRAWMAANFRTEEAVVRLTAPAETHWNSRLFTADLAPGLKIGFWQSENPLRGRPIAIEGDLSAEGKRFAIVVARWNSVITDRLLQGSLDALLLEM